MKGVSRQLRSASYVDLLKFIQDCGFREFDGSRRLCCVEILDPEDIKKGWWRNSMGGEFPKTNEIDGGSRLDSKQWRTIERVSGLL